MQGTKTNRLSDQQYAQFGAEKSAFVAPEASQQDPREFLVTIFHTRPYQAVPECVTLGQWMHVWGLGCLVLDHNVVLTQVILVDTGTIFI